jgi:DnaJ-class molecular chaperone
LSDLYSLLGVARDADADTIRKAYRKLAKQHHPDLNPGDKKAEERFKAIASANDILSDADKRARYDRGEIDDSGEPRQARPSYSQHAGGAEGRRYQSQSADGAEYSDIFSDLFRERGRPRRPMRGDDRSYLLDVAFLDAVTGATSRLNLPGGQTLDVQIPVGIAEGQVLRLRGKGDPGEQGAPPGDALIEIRIRPHKVFRRDGDNIELDLPVTLAEAILGGKVAVPTPTGSVTMTIPPASDTGTRLRLRGRGIPAHAGKPAGDQFVTLLVVLDKADAGLAAFLRTREDAPAFDPRSALMAAAP